MPRRSTPFLVVPALLLGLLVVPHCQDEICADCMSEKCSDLIAYCDEDADCKCISDCMGKKGIPGVDDCMASCNVDTRPTAFIPLEECVAVSCPDSADECASNGELPTSDSVGSSASDSDTDSGSDSAGSGGTSGGSGSTTNGGTTTGGVGGGDLADCGFDPGLTFDPDGANLQLESADKSVCVRIERRDDGAGSLANTKWTLLEMQVGSLGAVSLVDDSANLCWYSTHHNFLDWARAWTGNRHHDLKLREDGHGGPRTYELHTFAQGPLTGGDCGPGIPLGTEPIGGMIELFPFSP